MPPPPQSARFDLDSIRRSVGLFLPPDAVTELRIPKSGNGVMSGYFSDPKLLTDAILEVNNKVPGIYVTLNPVPPDALARSDNHLTRNALNGSGTKDSEIPHRYWMLMDFDPVRLRGISSTDAEHDESIATAQIARDALASENWPAPALGDSGNGGHLLYAIDLPNDQESADLIRAVLQAAAQRWSTPRTKVDTTVFNASRISKVYGTFVKKGDSTAERPHRLSRILDVPNPITPVPIERLRALAAEVRITPPPSAAPKAFAGSKPFDIPGFISKYALHVKSGPEQWESGTRWVLDHCPFNPEHGAKDAAIFLQDSGRPGFKCFHDSCADNHWPQFRRLYEADRTPKPYTNGHAAVPAEFAEPLLPAANPRAEHDAALLTLCTDIITSKQAHRMYESGLFDLISKASPGVVLQVRTLLRKEFKKEMILSGVGSWTELWRTATKVGRRKTPELEDDPPAGSLVEIQISNRQLRDISSDAIKQIQAKNEPPSLFVRSGALVHVIQDEKERPSVSIVTEPRLRGVLARTADFMKFDRFGELRNAFPPPEVVRDILAFNPQSWPFPALSSVAEVPVLRPNGTILDQPGYDADSGIFYAPASTLKSFPLPASPTQSDVKAARECIEEAIGEFPYADQASHANMYGLLLTPVLRPAILGCAPLAVVDAPMAGTGKSLITDVLSIITTGRPAAMMPYPYKEEEMQKQIAASLSAGRQLIVFDNLQGELKSPALALAITAKEFEARILGLSRNMTVPNVSTWIVTGNNIKPAGDMPRRCYQIRLNAKDSKPFMGREFKHQNLIQWVTDNRSELLHALLVIARYWYADGCQSYINSPVGSFENWHRTIGSIVTHARIPGFLANYRSFIEGEDDSPRQWEGFLNCLFEQYAERTFTVADMLDRATWAQSSIPETYPAEIADCLDRKGTNHRISVGKMFRNRRETRYGYGEWQYWLERVEGESEHKGSAEWRVNREPAKKSG